MPIIKYIDRLRRMDDLIRRKATGSPEAFASKMGIDRSTLMRYLAELRKLDAPIYFDSIKQSYYYEEEVSFEFGFRKMSDRDLIRKVGGNFMEKNCQSQNMRPTCHSLAVCLTFKF